MQGHRRNPRVILATALGAGFLLLAGVAIATPGIGIISAPVHARGTLDERQIVHSKSGVHLKTRGSRGDAITHIARNESATDEVELWATYLVPGAPGTGFRNDVSPAPSGC
jgi:hypothetical protein